MDDTNKTMLCRVCGIEKSLTEFYLRKDNNKYRTDCRACFKIRGKIVREKKRIISPSYLKKIEKHALLERGLKTCTKCKEIKSQSEFGRNKYTSRCKVCLRQERSKYLIQHRGRSNATARKYHKENPEKTLLKRIRAKAKKYNIPFNLDLTDIIIPEFCPILGLKLEKADGKPNANSPSMDKFVPELGYIKGNVFVISFKANTIKSNGTAEDHEKIAKWMREIENKKTD